MFYKELLATKIDGKEFDPDKKHEEPGKYGKAMFADKVVRPQKDVIDFSGFEKLLDRIVATLDDYAAKAPAA